MAELLGSDYAIGIKGVGVVNATEIIAAFHGTHDGLQEFKTWLETVDEFDRQKKKLTKKTTTPTALSSPSVSLPLPTALSSPSVN